MRLARALAPLLTLLVGCAHPGSAPEPTTPAPEPDTQEPATTETAAVEPGPAASAPADEPESAEDETAAAEPASMTMPTECAEGPKLCVPPFEFVQRLCKGKYPSVAVVMFEKSSPWTRAYIRQEEVDAVNTQGGPASDQKLVFGEEVIVLHDTRANADGFQVSGGGYFVLRWDGTCATVSDYEVVDYAPGMLKNAPIVWKYLDPALRQALLAKPNIKNAHTMLRQECHGARPGQGGPPCERARRLLNAHLTLAVRSGMDLPPPQRLP